MKVSAKDLIGRKYGRLMVISRLPNRKGRVTFECKCTCGNVIPVMSGHLKNGHTRSCGCLQIDVASKDLTGKAFGLWLVVKSSGKKDKSGATLWLCKCQCGITKTVSARSLLEGSSQACVKCAGILRKKDVCKFGHDIKIWGRGVHRGCRACEKNRHLQREYGISLEEFIDIYELQQGKCAICGKNFGSYVTSKLSNIAVDHDHKKFKRKSVRGLLCGGKYYSCNYNLGSIDSVDWLQSATRYLENPPAQKIINKEENAEVHPAPKTAHEET